MEYVVDVKDRVRGKISNRCRIQMIHDVYYSLDAEHKDLFTKSCFGHLLNVANMKIALQMVHQLILRSVKTSKQNEVWFKFGNQLARFGLEEFTLVTGLKAGELEFEDESLGLQCHLLQNHFKKNKGKITRKQLLSAFQKCSDQPDKFKLGLLLILAYVLLATEENTNLNLWWFYLVDDLDRFNNYARGKRSYKYTIAIFKSDLGKKLKQCGKNDRYPYNFHGFPFAIMICALEAIPGLGEEFAHKLEGDRIPRMLGWEFEQLMREGEKVNRFLEYEITMRKVKVNCTLVPTLKEADEEFWQGMTPLDDVEDSRVDNSLNEDGGKESKEDAPSISMHHQPCDRPSSSHNNNVTQVDIQEMKELERRLLRVITDRFDQLTG
ncbi:uncharacterized protein LOC127790500 [Diospyros lotus]|uniref:uncharacterized protein LOC127790500 n=1 Tax=Diospyros lotus TaxID=55363 RepID=UPI00224DE6E4|nr:uncharacterized protein LOC127790500 [Diospyros lotus]